MRRFLHRFFKRQYNKIKFSWKTSEVTPHCKDIYVIVLTSLYHPSRDILCDPITGDVIVTLDELGYDIVLTKNDVVITNHDFPNLGSVCDAVRDRLLIKAKIELSRIRQIKKNEILANNRDLVREVKQKVISSDRKARLNK